MALPSTMRRFQIELSDVDRGVYEMLHQMHRALAEESSKDSVTGLMSLSAFEERVDSAIARSQRRGSKHALLALTSGSVEELRVWMHALAAEVVQGLA